MDLASQIVWLLILAIPIACVSWTVTHEEIFREPHEFFVEKSKIAKTFLSRKFFYLFTCEYCFSHYVALFFVFFADFKLLKDDWFGYVIAWFSVIFVANVYMSLFAFIRQDIKKEKYEIEAMLSAQKPVSKTKDSK